MKESLTHKENIVRINKAIRYIQENLSEQLTLEIVASQAYYSPFHFHRLFKLAVGETVANFISRKRIEKSAVYLAHKKELTVTEISEKVGFTSISVFSRAFKKYYGISPEKFKSESPEKYSQITKTKSKKGKIEVTFQQYIYTINTALNWIDMNAKNIEVTELPDIEVAYVSYKGKMEEIKTAYHSLIKWATPMGYMNNPNLKMITIYHDSPKISDPNNIGMSACMILENLTKTHNDISLRTIKKGKYIVSKFEIKPYQFQEAWENSFAWMIENGHQKDDRDPFEIYYNNAENHPEHKFIVDFCIPIK